MKVAIIGAGKMGRWFAKFFLEQGFSVVVSDKDEEKLSRIREELHVETADNLGAVRSTDRIVICVPIDNFESAVKEISPCVNSDQEVMDICSVKEQPVKIMHKYLAGRAILGTHPMFGPGAKSIRKQNFVLTPTNSREEKLARNFGDWLKEKGVNVFIMSPRKHDELMSVVLGLPYFLSLTICDTLINRNLFLDAKKISGASYKLLLTLMEAIASEETEFITNIQVGLPDTVKFQEAFLENAGEWLNLMKKNDKLAFADKVRNLKKQLSQIEPQYFSSYEAMHRMLEHLRSEN